MLWGKRWLERLFISRQKWHSEFEVLVMQVFFPICTSTWCVNNYICRQGKGIDRRNESTRTVAAYYF